MFLKIAQKVTLHLGYFWKKVCHQELSKIAQFDHTAYISIERALNARKAVKKKQRAVALIERSMQKNGIIVNDEWRRRWPIRKIDRSHPKIILYFVFHAIKVSYNNFRPTLASFAHFDFSSINSMANNWISYKVN